MNIETEVLRVFAEKDTDVVGINILMVFEIAINGKSFQVTSTTLGTCFLSINYENDDKSIKQIELANTDSLISLLIERTDIDHTKKNKKLIQKELDSLERSVYLNISDSLDKNYNI